MKKLFFFRSHSSNNANNDQPSPPSTDKQVYWEKPRERVEKSAKNKHGSEERVNATTPRLRRSLSFSSGSLYDTGKGLITNGDQAGSPSSTSYHSNKHSGHQPSRFRTLTPERQTRKKMVDAAAIGNDLRVENFDPIFSRERSDLSDISSYCSSNTSSKVLDRYIDGEQQVERCVSKANSSRGNQFENGNTVVKRPPRFQFTAPVPHNGGKQKLKSQSFRDPKVSQLKVSSKDGANSEYLTESPRKLAKHVVERLSQSQFLPEMRSKELDTNCPITIEDVYGRSLNRHSDAYTDDVPPTMDWHTETSDESPQDEVSEFLENEPSFSNRDRDGKNYDDVVDTDLELYKQFKEAGDRAAILQEELREGNFLQLRELSVPALIQTIRSLMEEKLNMALEVSAVIEDRITEKAWFREKLKLERAELKVQTRRLEKEKNESKLALEKELDRRSTDWSLKLEKYQAEEQSLRERVRVLAEQNVCLQRDISSFSEMERDARSTISSSEKQLTDLSIQVKEASEENHYLHKTLSEMQEKTRAAEEGQYCIQRSYEEKVVECREMHQAISRLQRTCNDQEKTSDGLRLLCEELGSRNFKANPDFELKLQVEHKRLTGVEHGLRKELESYRVQVDSLRRENIDLLDRLKSHGKEGTFSTFKLDRELQNRIDLLQNQVAPLLMESNQLGRRLLEYAKTNGGSQLNKGPTSASCLDGDRVLVECGVKLQGLERAAENLTLSLQTMSDVLQEKSDLLHEKSASVDPPTPSSCNESQKPNKQKTEDIIKSELKAETLVTRLLREKLYSKEQEEEQLQAELAAAVRGNDILKSEVQNALDNCACLNHKMKEVQLKMIKKDEMVNQLQGDLQECKKELAVVRGILPKVSEERDLMWEEVKHHTETNMLLNAEINSLKKQIEVLDEDILLKEGQITILKDSIGKPFDLLASPDAADSFCWTDNRKS